MPYRPLWVLLFGLLGAKLLLPPLSGLLLRTQLLLPQLFHSLLALLLQAPLLLLLLLLDHAIVVKRARWTILCEPQWLHAWSRQRQCHRHY
jgi:hypothetical protein